MAWRGMLAEHSVRTNYEIDAWRIGERILEERTRQTADEEQQQAAWQLK